MYNLFNFLIFKVLTDFNETLSIHIVIEKANRTPNDSRQPNAFFVILYLFGI